MRFPKRILLLTVLMFITCGRAPANSNREVTAASLLFDRFETVFYAKTNLVFAPPFYKGLSDRELLPMKYPFARLLGSVDSLGRGALTKIQEDSEAVLVGAKDFRAPTGLGRVRSQFCYIVILKSDASFELKKYFTISPAVEKTKAPIWQWSAKLGEFGQDDPRPSSLYAVQVEESYVVISNNSTEIKAVVAGLNSLEQNLQLLSKLRDWDSVNQHPFWGYRKYNRFQTEADPAAAGTLGATKNDEALMFFIEFEKRIGVLRLISSQSNEAATAKLSKQGVLPRFQQVGPEIWEMTIQLTGDEDSFERMFDVMVLFGFGIYV